MRNSPEQGGFSRGEALARHNQESLGRVPLTDPRVQVFLALLAFPGDQTAMSKWVAGEENSLSSKFRAFVEDQGHVPAGTDIDTRDPEALQALLKGVRNHSPERTTH